MTLVFRVVVVAGFFLAGPAAADQAWPTIEEKQAAARKKAAEQRAAKKLSRECIVDLVVASCTALGRKLELGVGVDRNFEAASELYVMTCDNGDPEGCFHLAALAEDGRGVPKDPERADALLERACDGGVAAACERRGAASAN